MNYLLFEILVCFLYPLPILSYKISLIIFRMALVRVYRPNILVLVLVHVMYLGFYTLPLFRVRIYGIIVARINRLHMHNVTAASYCKNRPIAIKDLI